LSLFIRLHARCRDQRPAMHEHGNLTFYTGCIHLS
jgi:hypothetical protein